MSDCLFCRIATGELPGDIVYEDEKMVVFRDIAPKAQVHLLAIPREHIESLNGLTEEHDALIAYMMRQLPVLAKAQGLESGFRTIINTGPGGGQVVFHLHIHLLGGTGLPGF
ncbi:MAG: histidine triad nucleotide-binding protein [Chromatiales bacterium]|nr:histidine triad nucleotide-binding protein [Chromatiales bacterium]